MLCDLSVGVLAAPLLLGSISIADQIYRLFSGPELFPPSEPAGLGVIRLSSAT